jgi:hypothetical protein
LVNGFAQTLKAQSLNDDVVNAERNGALAVTMVSAYHFQ